MYHRQSNKRVTTHLLRARIYVICSCRFTVTRDLLLVQCRYRAPARLARTPRNGPSANCAWALDSLSRRPWGTKPVKPEKFLRGCERLTPARVHSDYGIDLEKSGKCKLTR